PFVAADWDALRPGEVRLRARTARRFTSRGGRARTANGLDPVNGDGECRTFPADDDPGAATYRFPAARGAGYTLVGSPTVTADRVVSGSSARGVAGLGDADPRGTRALAAQPISRPRTDTLGPQVFQLHPNGWHFPAGHRPKLELLGQSPPYGRPAGGR